MGIMTIGEVARQAGIRPSTIRYYERLGLLPAPGRIGGQRRYRPEILRTIAAVQLARRAGLTLNEITGLLHGFADGTPPPERWESVARPKLKEIESQIEELRDRRQLLEALRQCRCATIEECGGAIKATSG